MSKFGWTEAKGEPPRMEVEYNGVKYSIPYYKLGAQRVTPEQIRDFVNTARQMGFPVKLHVGPRNTIDPYLEAEGGIVLAVYVDLASTSNLRSIVLSPYLRNAERLPQNRFPAILVRTDVRKLPSSLKFDEIKIIAPWDYTSGTISGFSGKNHANFLTDIAKNNLSPNGRMVVVWHRTIGTKIGRAHV